MIDKTNKKFITISLMCVFLLVMMISFGAVNVRQTFSATEVACYACTDSSSGEYVWGDYSGNTSCEKMVSYTTKESCLVNNCSNTETLADDGTCVNSNGNVTVLFKSGSLTAYRDTCQIKNGSCRIPLKEYRDAIGWSESADCSNVVELSEEYITFTQAKTYTYYACNEKQAGNKSTTAASKSSENNTQNNNDNNNQDDQNIDRNQETGSASIIVVFLGAFLMMVYACYVYRNSMNSE